MKRFDAALFALFSLLPVAAVSAAPVLNVHESVMIHASPDAVWAKVKDFDGLNTWHPAVESDKITTGTNNTVGAERHLSLHGGGTIDEKLLSFDDKHHRFSYAILGGVLPVSDYTSTLVVKAAGKDRSKVTWSGSFKRKHVGANPPADENDATATKAIGGVYRGGLDNLKKVVEGK
jgi:mxaD protein